MTPWEIPAMLPRPADTPRCPGSRLLHVGAERSDVTFCQKRNHYQWTPFGQIGTLAMYQ